MSPSTVVCRLCVNSCNDFRRLYDDRGQGNELYEWAREYFHPKILDMEKARHLTVICSKCYQYMCDFHNFQTIVIVAQLKLVEEEDQKISIRTDETANSVGSTSGKVPIDPLAIKVEEEFIAGSGQLEESTQAGSTVALKGSTIDPTGWLVKHEDKSKTLPVLALTNVDLSTHNLCQTGGHIPPIEDTNDAFVDQATDDNYETFSVDDCSEVDALSRSTDDEKHIQLPKLEIMDVMPDSEFSSDDEIPLAKCAAKSPSAKQDHPSKTDLSLTTGGSDSFDPDSKKKRGTLDDLLIKWMAKIKCVACPKSYSRLSQLEDHFCQTHPKEQFYIECCYRKFRKGLRLKEHLICHIDPDTFKCDLCGKACRSGRAIRDHMADVHPEYHKFKCKLCGKGFSVERSLNSHYTYVHTSGVLQADGQTVYTCPECGKTAYSAVALQRHRYTAHRRRSAHNKCPICSKSCTSPLQLREHVASHQKKHLYVCAYCPQTFRNISYASCHRRKLHPHESNKDFYRKIDKSLKEPTQIGELNSESPDCYPMCNLTRLDDLVAKWMPNIKCVACLESYPSVGLLEDHFTKNHPSEEFYISCCSRKFAERWRLKDHLKLHGDPDAFRCHPCNISYVTGKALRDHTNFVHQERCKFPCKECPRCFMSARGLKMHYRRSHECGDRKKTEETIANDRPE